MRQQTSVLVSSTSLLAFVLVAVSLTQPFGPWQIFSCYFLLGVVSACLKIELPGGQAALSFNVPYILLSIVWLPLPAALVVAAASALVICTFKASPANAPVQIVLNVANVINSTSGAWFAYHLVLKATNQTLPALVFAATAYFVTNSITVSAVLATVEDRTVFSIWRQFFWSYPYYAIGAALAAIAYSIELHLGRLTSQMVLPLVYLIYRTCRSYAGRLQERHKHAADMAALHLRTIEGLALAIEAKDQNTHDHLCRVRVYAAGIASELKLSQDEREALMAAALLHDIGKLAVPEYIINKPGRLTPEEFDKIKIHPIVGAEILKRVSFPYPVDPIVRSHHEQWDGCGYPDGLKGEQIPVGARILAVVDCFDALASDRPYRRALTLPDALAHVQRLSGIQFDPEVVGILAAHYQELEVKAREESRKMEPLRTDIVVPRGHAPSAGFEKSGPVREVHGEYLPVSTTRTRMESEMVRIFTETLTADITEDTLPCAIATLGVLIPFDIVIIYVREGAMLRPYYMDGDYEEALLSVQLAVGQGLCGWVAQSRQDILNGNPSVEVETWANPAMARMHSTLAHPLVNKEDSVVGVIAFYHAQPDFFTHAHLQALQLVQASLTSFLACALENPPGSLPQTLNRSRKPAADLANVG